LGDYLNMAIITKKRKTIISKKNSKKNGKPRITQKNRKLKTSTKKTKKLLKGGKLLSLRRRVKHSNNLMNEDLNMMEKFIFKSLPEIIENNEFAIYFDGKKNIKMRMKHSDEPHSYDIIKEKNNQTDKYMYKIMFNNKPYMVDNNTYQFDNLFYMVIFFININNNNIFLTNYNNKTNYNNDNKCDYIKDYIGDTKAVFPYDVINPTLYKFEYPKQIINKDDKTLKIIIHKIKHNQKKHNLPDIYYLEKTSIVDQDYLFLVITDSEGNPTKYPITYDSNSYHIVNRYSIINNPGNLCKYDTKMYTIIDKNSNNNTLSYETDQYNATNLHDLLHKLPGLFNKNATYLFPKYNPLLKVEQQIQYDTIKYSKTFEELQQQQQQQLQQPQLQPQLQLQQQQQQKSINPRKSQSTRSRKPTITQQYNNNNNSFTEKLEKFAKTNNYIHDINRKDTEELLKMQSGLHGSYLFRIGNNRKNIVLSVHTKSDGKIYHYILDTNKVGKFTFKDINGKEFTGNREEIIDYMFKIVKP